MANILIGHSNQIAAATLSGGTWNASYPLANVKDPRLALVARTSTSAGFALVIDLGVSRRIRAVGVVNHNLTATATIRVEGSTTSGFTSSPVNLLSSAWPSGTSAETMTYPRPTWGAAVDGFNRYWRLTFSDPGQTAGFIQIGRIFIGEGWQPSVNMENGATLGIEAETAIETSLSGAEFYGPRPERRRMRFSVPPVPNAEAFGQGFEVQRRSLDYREVFVIADADDAANRARRDFLGRFRTLSDLEQTFGTYSSIGYEVLELL